MNQEDNSAKLGFDEDAPPDLSRDGWPKKFAKIPVRHGWLSREKRKQSTVIRLPQDTQDIEK